MSYVRNAIAISFFAAAALFVPQTTLLAQGTDPKPAAAVVASLSNSYVQFNMGISGTAKGVDPAGVVGDYPVSGRYSVLALGGDPLNDIDNSLPLWGGGADPIEQTFWIRINDITQQFGTNGTWLQVPTLHSPPRVGLMRGATGPYLDAIWSTTNATGAATVIATMTATLVRDQVRIELNLKNAGTVGQSIGLGAYTTPMNGSYPFIPGVGLTNVQGSGDQFYAHKLAGSSVPPMLEAYNSITDPLVVSRMLLRGEDATTPDYMAIGQWTDLRLSTVQLPLGYTPNPTTPVTEPAALLEWAQKPLAAGASRTYVFYQGVGAATSSWTHRLGTRVIRDHVALAVQGPRAMQYDTTTAGAVLKPTQLSIKAYVYNLDTDPGPYKLDNVSAYLVLPKGLEFLPGYTALQQIGEVDVNSECAPVEWKVRATGEYTGELEYYVSAMNTPKPGGPAWQQVVRRRIMIPTDRKFSINGQPQLVSVPFTGRNPDVNSLFSWGTAQHFAMYYQPSTRKYADLAQFTPGQGFWMRVSNTEQDPITVVELASDAMIAGEIDGKQAEEISVPIQRDWNIIGNPYVYPVYLGQLLVNYNKGGQLTTISFDDAVAARLISRTVFWWNSQKGAYDYLKGNNDLLVPWRGYWIRAYVPVTIVFRPAMWPEGDVNTFAGI